MIEPLDIKNPAKVNPVLMIYKELLNQGKQADIIAIGNELTTRIYNEYA